MSGTDIQEQEREEDVEPFNVPKEDCSPKNETTVIIY